MCEIEAVIFDMDGVIFDTERKCWHRSWSELALVYKIKNVEKLFEKIMGANIDDISKLFYSEYGSDFPFDNYYKDVKSRVSEIITKEGLVFKDGAPEILHYLKEKGIPTALATSTATSNTKRYLNNMKIYDCFDKIITGDMVTKCKPDPEIYVKAAHALNIKPEKCVAIEDSFNGIRSAYNAKLMPIMVPDTVEPTAEIEKLLFRKFSNLFETLEFLKQCGM